MAEFLLEILSEEIPARMQARAADDLRRLVTDGLTAGGITFESARALVTPRRLVLAIDGLPLAGPDLSEEKRGPRVGAPAQAMDGFLKSTGLTVEQLEQRDTGKGVFWFAVIERKGRATVDLLKEVVEATMAAFPWPKSQRWGTHTVRWVRPVQSILALFDGAVIPVQFGPVAAGNVTRGHRFLAPESFAVTGFADYAERLRAAKVILDPAERRDTILTGALALARAEGLTLKDDEGLLAEVAGLVEWPVPLIGSIDDAFMDVPAEVLITSMRAHQKYFSLLKADGSLAPRFIVVSNMAASDGGKAIVSGNQRVLRARLSDAKFFWDTDRRHRLDSRLPKLAERTFYAGLGTMRDKADRIAALAKAIAAQINADPALAERAGLLAKADLSSEMVGEFPELQGVMGRYYARNDGEAAEVAEAIAAHYSPVGPSDSCPTAPIAVAVALADKIDSLVGFFAIDEKPTGSKDPFALRRAALGVIRLIVENGLRIKLSAVFGPSWASFGGTLANNADQTVADLLSFFADRLAVAWKEQGIRHDLINAVFALGGQDDLVLLRKRVEALASFVASDDGSNLLVAYRRAANIVRIEEKKDGTSFAAPVDAAKLVQAEEQALAAALDHVGPTVEAALQAEDFAAAMAALATLRRPLDAFFEQVTVNADQPDLRVARLGLLAAIGTAMGRVADFSKIEG
ncbi:glycine--tRNA ligase subunit beta [Magnetospirillum fulvum]|uniref:Glycine--tRNA ligase beta subunit n=1 Tax=Magnetospirillum fulvum MGU-K5 TaxID=1316936 RepID=S9SBN9_MAGFU|nr:glycine--tRNA ligase subunit beta [Magnetospirillum fulvum]EPY03337.1 glycyl-tRNA synthetase [Magnetospirillum fulvum MGU-K5]